jgi:DNA primase
MICPNAAREIRAHLTNARTLCAALGLRMALRANPRQVMICCPWHTENTPSCSVRIAKDGTVAVHCHACGQSADALGLIAQVHRIDDFREVLRIAGEIAKVPRLAAEMVREPKEHTEPETLSGEIYDRIWATLLEACSPMCKIAPHVAEYLFGRGIFADAEAAWVRGLPRDIRELVGSLLSTFERTHLELAGVLCRGRDAIDWPDWPLLIPWRDRFGRITCVQRRRLDDGRPKYRSPRGRSPRAPYGIEVFAKALEFEGPEGEVVITEGALDCLARRRIARADDERAAVIGVYSASAPDVGLPLDLIKGRRVVLALDKDDAGDNACTKIAGALRAVASEFFRERPNDAKDWAEALTAGAVP